MKPFKGYLSERDRLQHHIAQAVRHCSSDIVFKGGTLLRTCVMPNYRYSADLDYDTTLEQDQFWEVFAEICRIAAKTARADIAIEGSPPSVAYDLKWATKISSGRMDIDVRWLDSEQSIPPCTHWSLQPNHSDIDTKQKLILGYTEPSILAAKLACVASLERGKSRDLYDIYNILYSRLDLLAKGVSIGTSYFGIPVSSEILEALAYNESRFENDWAISVDEEIIPRDIAFETVFKFVRRVAAGIA